MDTHKLPQLTKRGLGRACFSGVAPQLLQDQLWSSILEALLPSIYDQVLDMAVGKAWDKLLVVFENNPISAAYGAMVIRDKYKRPDRRSMASASMPASPGPDSSSLTFSRRNSAEVANMMAAQQAAVAQAAAAQAANPDAYQPPTWHSIGLQVYFDPILVSKWEAFRSAAVVETLVDTMLVAHGPVHPEKLSPKAIYEHAAKLSPAEGGGWSFMYWIDLFSKSLALQLADIEDEEEAEAMASVTDTNFEQQCMDYARMERLKSPENVDAFCRPQTTSQALTRFYQVCPNTLFSVSLEVLCPFCSPALLFEVVQELNRRGVHVAAVSGYDWTQISGVSQLRQKIQIPGGPLVKAPQLQEVKLLHSHAEISKALSHGHLNTRDAIMFNGGTMIHYKRMSSGKSKQASYNIPADVLVALRHLKTTHGFSLGFYTDEATLDQAAAAILIKTANEQEELFDLGFAWAGVNASLTNLVPTFSVAYIGVEGSKRFELAWEQHTSRRLTITMPATPDAVSLDIPARPEPRAAWGEGGGGAAAAATSPVTAGGGAAASAAAAAATSPSASARGADAATASSVAEAAAAPPPPLFGSAASDPAIDPLTMIVSDL